MAKAPRCKHCGHNHWLNEPHRYEKTEPVTRSLRDWPINVTYGGGWIETNDKGEVVATNTGPVRGRPRKHATNAARQRAWRAKKARA